MDKTNTKAKGRSAQLFSEAGETPAPELELATAKFARQQEAIIKAEGPGASASSVAIAQRRSMMF
jgi:hypothetical protein